MTKVVGCKNCIWFESESDTNSSAQGECYYNPPRVLYHSDKLETIHMRPFVNKHDYCSKGEEKPLRITSKDVEALEKRANELSKLGTTRREP